MTFAVLATLLAANPYLVQAKVFVDHRQWEQCLDRLDVAVERSAEDQAGVELLRGVCRLGLGQEQDAREQFAAALKLDPSVQLPAGLDSRVVSFFERVKAHPEEAVVLEPVVASAPVAAVVEPPSVSGQMGRKHLVLPLSLGGVAVVSTVIATVLGVQAKTLEGQANAAMFEADVHSLGDSARSNATGANVMFGVALTALAAAVIIYLVQN
ncbi:MAG: hypothetical protein QM723_26695 [Myxococcaceae bacterium]